MSPCPTPVFKNPLGAEVRRRAVVALRGVVVALRGVVGAPRRVVGVLGCIVVAGLFLIAGCDSSCASPSSLHTTLRVHVPHATYVPRYCTSERDDSCREADHVSGLTHSFEFEQRAEGTFWCSYADPPGEFRTRSCDSSEVVMPQPSQGARADAREFHLLVEGCDLSLLAPPRPGDACGVLTQPNGLPADTCARSSTTAPIWGDLGDPTGEAEEEEAEDRPALYCRSSDSTCQPLPESCASDADCHSVAVCDETHLCVRFACDTSRSQCVWPDECLDTTDCERSHSRCDPLTGRCDTFTCETGRCVGAG